MPRANVQQLGQELAKARARAGLAVRDVATATGIHAATIYRLENGDIASPNATHLQQLAEVLGVDVEDFYAAAGYLTGPALPALQPYLRAKYGLDPHAANRVAGYVRSMQDEKGGNHDAGQGS